MFSSILKGFLELNLEQEATQAATFKVVLEQANERAAAN